MATQEQKEKIIKETYNEINLIVRLLKGVKKLSNDVVGAQIAQILVGELRANHASLSEWMEEKTPGVKADI